MQTDTSFSFGKIILIARFISVKVKVVILKVLNDTNPNKRILSCRSGCPTAVKDVINYCLNYVLLFFIQNN